ncbi:MAG: hypothetical protein FWH22_08990 [Fibromonadales bacterium]|nr:hypothetical protein [Fibromonadales bacterium]
MKVSVVGLRSLVISLQKITIIPNGVELRQRKNCRASSYPIAGGGFARERGIPA